MWRIIFLISSLYNLIILINGMSSVSKCTISVKNATICAKRLTLFGDRTVHFPEHLIEMDSFCQNLQENIKCLSKYQRCMEKGFRKSLLRAMVGFLNQELMVNMCSPDAKRFTFGVFQCFDNKRIRSEPMHVCYDKYIVSLLALREMITTKSHRINHDEVRCQTHTAICCAMAQLRACILQFVEDSCVAIYGDELRAFSDGLFERNFAYFQQCPDQFKQISFCQQKLNGTIIERFDTIQRSPVPPQNERSSLLLTMDLYAQMYQLSYRRNNYNNH